MYGKAGERYNLQKAIMGEPQVSFGFGILSNLIITRGIASQTHMNLESRMNGMVSKLEKNTIF